MDERGPWTWHLTKLRQVFTMKRSPQEVVAILTSFIDGEPTGHGADDFMTIPIRDPALDAIRDDFERLVERFIGQWQPQLPFPEAGLPELQELIDRVTALEQEKQRGERQGQ